MKPPHFPEANHEIIQALFHQSDRDLVRLFQQHSGSGRYFTAIFCRYSALAYTLIRHSARSPVQADYLFALTWRHIFHELGGIDYSEASDASPGANSFSLQGWLINVTALCINRAAMPEVESIHYCLKDASPPFWCYVERALDQLPPTERLMVVMARAFRWSNTRIAAYLQAEKETLSPGQVRERLQEAYRELEAAIPEDIRIIYLGQWASFDPESPLSHPDELDDLLQVPELMQSETPPQ